MTSIATMPAGPELDALVAAEVGDAGKPSTNKRAAWRALAWWRQQHPHMRVRIDMWDDLDWPSPYFVEMDGIRVNAPTLALAISRAIAMAGEVG
ncbi:MAG: hypothetical protein KGL39_43415 [Patescibacteria group bacterium]|nr:hypothetical protein [Patescibacteria group bacterium]